MASVVPNNEATRFKAGAKQVEIARQGGIASGKAKREKATMLSTLRTLLDEESTSGKTYRELATLGLIKGAMSGNAINFKTIVELLGEEKGGEKTNGVIDDLIEALQNAKKD